MIRRPFRARRDDLGSGATGLPARVPSPGLVASIVIVEMRWLLSDWIIKRRWSFHWNR
jgi:hypothetical protein